MVPNTKMLIAACRLFGIFFSGIEIELKNVLKKKEITSVLIT